MRTVMTISLEPKLAERIGRYAEKVGKGISAASAELFEKGLK